jgi:hypothetical protein
MKVHCAGIARASDRRRNVLSTKSSLRGIRKFVPANGTHFQRALKESRLANAIFRVYSRQRPQLEKPNGFSNIWNRDHWQSRGTFFYFYHVNT